MNHLIADPSPGSVEHATVKPAAEIKPAPAAVLNEPDRLEAVRATGLLDTPTEKEFDRLTRLAARLTGAPVTFISLVTEDRDFYKSCFGFPEPLASERQLTGTTFCHYALVSRGPLVIEDTLENPIYAEVPTVHSMGVRAYLGVPLITSSGAAIGSFCAIDFKPRKWTLLDIEVMRELAASTLTEIELRSALKRLDGEQRRLDVLLQHLPVGVVFAEAPSGRVVMSNKRAWDLVGESRFEKNSLAASSKWEDRASDGSLVRPEDRPLARAIRGEVVNSEEIEYVRQDGRKIWLRIDAAPVLDIDGAVIGGVAAFHDIDHQRRLTTENARLYEEAQQANRAKDDFFAAVSHELRTPMTSIMGWARLLKMEGMENPDAVEAVDAITSSAKVQAQLVDDLLDVSRIATGKLSLTRERLSLNDVVQESVLAASPAADGKGVHLRLQLGADGIVDADRSRLRQIVGNLLSNSIKFTPPGGLVAVTSLTELDHGRIVVTDTGRGIDADLLPHVFDRLRQAQSAEQGGLGLGLTIVRHLVEMHGGEIRVESEGEGKGATFSIEIPLVQRS